MTSGNEIRRQGLPVWMSNTILGIVASAIGGIIAIEATKDRKSTIPTNGGTWWVKAWRAVATTPWWIIAAVAAGLVLTLILLWRVRRRRPPPSAGAHTAGTAPAQNSPEPKDPALLVYMEREASRRRPIPSEIVHQLTQPAHRIMLTFRERDAAVLYVPSLGPQMLMTNLQVLDAVEEILKHGLVAPVDRFGHDGELVITPAGRRYLNSNDYEL